LLMNIHWAGGDACHTVEGRGWVARVAGDLRALCDVARKQGRGGRLLPTGPRPPLVSVPGAWARAGVSQLA
jgi:hypothetical protein